MTAATANARAMSASPATSPGLYVHYGCGLCAPKEWLNFDASPMLKLQRLPLIGSLMPASKFGRWPANAKVGDIRDGLPVAEKSAAGVYCAHVLEHLALDDFRLALRNTYRILRPGGIFRLVMPDLRAMMRKYLDAGDTPQAAMNFMQHSGLGRDSRARGLIGNIRGWIGNARHRWLWDYAALEPELKKAGFVDVRRASYGDYADAYFATVEFPDRFPDAVGAECRRPLES